MHAVRILSLIVVLFTAFPSAQAVEYEWHNTKGVAHSIREFSGTPFILHFWASWCVPCRAELPELAAWRKQHPNITLIPVSLDQNMADAQDFLNLRHLELPALVGDMGSAMQLGVRGLPTTLVIGTDGAIRRRYFGMQSWRNADFNRDILAALE